LQTLASKLSHELRTPLAVVRSSVDNLEHEDLTPQAREYVERARSGSERLGHILNAMSAASRVEQSIQSAEKESLDLAKLINECVEGYRAAYAERNIAIEMPDTAVMVLGCGELLSQMLDKLMDNARDFCPADGLIRFTLSADGKNAVIAVENDGSSLPEGMSGQLFESMISVREGKDDQVHMGLGLTIVRLVAEFHGGVALAENRPDGAGVRFVVRVPIQASASVA
jgi:two-component system sensor histidine kinase ChvG